MFKVRQWTVVLLPAMLILAAGVLLVLTRDAASPAGSADHSDKNQLVDQSPLQAAHVMAALATSPEEQHFAQEALRLGDHEVDLAFADAVRDAAEHPVKPTAETRQLMTRLSESEARVKAGNDRLERLKQQLAGAPERDLANLEQQSDLAQAQLELDQDALEDAREDLARAGGDPQSKIQRLLEEHEATQHQSGPGNAQATSSSMPNYQAENLLAQFSAWTSLRVKQQQLAQAQAESLTAAAALKDRHNALEKQVEEENTAAQNTPPPAGTATLAALRHRSADQKSLADLDKRIQDHQELAQNYGAWTGLVGSRLRVVEHGMIQSGLWILLIVLLVYLVDRVIDRFLGELDSEHRSLRTLRVVARFAAQVAGALLILLVVFGAPNQAPTILGLAGAGLTVALKDFIVGFFGWFVLMGRNGIRVGDWVEINGVGGEVIEIGLLRTVLLETGNWNDAGHPTGRKVAFVNSFAIEGHFFNFSTSGQWLWDELQVLVPASENPYPLIDAIRKVVSGDTAVNARMAEEEWKRATNRQRMQSFSAAAALNLRPTAEGVQVLVRYITRAHERHELRSRLYQAIVELLHEKKATRAMVGSGGERS